MDEYIEHIIAKTTREITNLPKDEPELTIICMLYDILISNAEYVKRRLKQLNDCNKSKTL